MYLTPPEHLPMSNRCPTCSRNVGNTGILCDVCKCWLHLACESLSADQCNALGSISGSIYCCKNCDRDQLLAGLQKVNTLQKNVESLSEIVTRQNTETMDAIRSLTETVNRLIQNAPTTPSIPDFTKSAFICDVAQELQERESKKDKLVILGLPETESEDPAESDTSVVNGFATQLGIDSGCIVETFRDGPKNRNISRPRILKVRFSSQGSRSSFLHGFKAVSPSQRCWVRPDLSYHQRERDRLLRKDLDEKNGRKYENGRVVEPGSNLYCIFKKQVCLRSDLPK